jgi:hypothetical protein
MNPTVEIDTNPPVPNGVRPLPHTENGFGLVDYRSGASSKSIKSGDTVAGIRHSQLRTFRKISREFFGAEANREYRKELLLFAWIACVAAAWPVGILLYHLTQWIISSPRGGPW